MPELDGSAVYPRDEGHDLTPPAVAPLASNGDLQLRRSPAEAGDDSVKRSPLSIDIPAPPSGLQTAFAALQHLPMPVLVLSSLKTVTFANDAMGRLLCLARDDLADGSIQDGIQSLHGQTLSQIGVDMLQNGQPVWVNWEDFLDSLDKDVAVEASGRDNTPQGRDSTTSHARTKSCSACNAAGEEANRHVAVDVVLSPSRCQPVVNKKTKRTSAASYPSSQTLAHMIVTKLGAANDGGFSLTFTSYHGDDQASALSGKSAKSWTKPNKFNSSPSSTTSVSPGFASTPSSTVSSPTLNTSFLPAGPPSRSIQLKAPSVLQKATRLKDALLNVIKLPAYAMWKDESIGIPNQALMDLLPERDGSTELFTQRDFLSQFVIYDAEDSTKALKMDDYPIIVICRTEKSYERRICLKDRTGALRFFDTAGEPIRDENTGECLGGIVLLKDVTDYMDRIAHQKAISAQQLGIQFELIANMIPQLVWTTTPDGSHDWFSQRWYDYTGLSPSHSLNEGWRQAFHPDDMPLSAERWSRALETGNVYNTEYRCRRRDGEWRWFLGRALPMRDGNGTIVKWLGTCTDIHEAVEAREAEKRTREQLKRVLETAKVSLWAIDRDRRVTIMEGNFSWHRGSLLPPLDSIMGTDIYEVFDCLEHEDDKNAFKKPIADILSGSKTEETNEIQMKHNGRSFRNRYIPILSTTHSPSGVAESFVDGVIGVSVDVTELRNREMDLHAQEKENARLLANALAAREASRMKSQFLANMSHEIRTPIAGVIGMSELLLDTELDDEQRDCAENVQRSANSLLCVINDILDLSKVESGKLDIEEVQFSLSVVVSDINKMMSFAAERKGLVYETEITPAITRDLRVMGDPGRCRQILTNLLTNSIKFTNNGSVKLKAELITDSEDTIDVRFTVEDTGIGIEEEVCKRLFKPFSQADSSTARRYGGTGLGLTISKNLVELMHGGIHLESNIGQGTIASFWIPFKKAEYTHNPSPLVDLGAIPDRLRSDMSVSVGSSDGRATPPATPVSNHQPRSNLSIDSSAPKPSPAPAAEERALDLSEAERRATNILVVEDNQINQQIALKTIRKLGFGVHAVWNGKECLDYLMEDATPERPDPDVILMDVQMPVCDGYLATQIIRNNEPYIKHVNLRDIPIIAMTASAIQGDREKCEHAGMDDYLAKPVKGKSLEKMLVKWAIEGRKKRTRVLRDSRQLTESPGPLQGSTPVDGGAAAQASGSAFKPPPQLSLDSASSGESRNGLASFDRKNALAKTSESENTSSHRRADEEEAAMSVRDNKLLDVAGNPRLQRLPSDDAHAHHHHHHHHHHAAREGPTHALTLENMTRFDGSQHLDANHGRGGGASAADALLGARLAADGLGDAASSSSLRVHGRSSADDHASLRRDDSGDSAKSPVRPSLGAGQRFESAETVRPARD